MSTREMMSQDQRTTTMSGLATTREASGAAIIVPVGGDEVCHVHWFWLYILLVVTIKAPYGMGRTLAEAVIHRGKTVAGVTPFLRDSLSPSKPRQLGCC